MMEHDNWEVQKGWGTHFDHIDWESTWYLKNFDSRDFGRLSIDALYFGTYYTSLVYEMH